MTADKAAKLIADEFHLDVFHDSLDDLKAKAAASASSSAGATSSSSAAASSSYTYATMPDKSKPTPVKSALTVDNPTPATVRLYFLDQDGQSHLKRILAPFQTVTDEAFEGTLMQKVKKEFSFERKLYRLDFLPLGRPNRQPPRLGPCALQANADPRPRCCHQLWRRRPFASLVH